MQRADSVLYYDKLTLLLLCVLEGHVRNRYSVDGLIGVLIK